MPPVARALGSQFRRGLAPPVMMTTFPSTWPMASSVCLVRASLAVSVNRCHPASRGYTIFAHCSSHRRTSFEGFRRCRNIPRCGKPIQNRPVASLPARGCRRGASRSKCGRPDAPAAAPVMQARGPRTVDRYRKKGCRRHRPTFNPESRARERLLRQDSGSSDRVRLCVRLIASK
jgi:hypothetical protein